jgi:hypothetical protein
LWKVPVPEHGEIEKIKKGGNTKKQNYGSEYVGEISQQTLHCPKLKKLREIETNI